MSTRAYRTLQALLMAGLGLFLLSRVWEGDVLYYISPPLIALELAAGLALLLLAEAALRARHRDAPVKRSSWRLAWLVLPIVLGVLLPAEPLGPGALAARGVNPPLPAAGELSRAAGGIPPAQRSLYEWAALSQAPDAALLNGQMADVTGFVYRAPGLPDGELLLVRYVSAGGAGGALAFAARVAWPAAADFHDGDWVQVRGPVQAAEWDGRPCLRIAATRVLPVPLPTQPYLSP